MSAGSRLQRSDSSGANRGRRAVLACILGFAGLFGAAAHGQSLPPVPFPVENPFSEPKRLLGKALFWDEQLSATNTMACGTCHRPMNAGVDPRPGANPGPDGLFGSFDDRVSSPGVVNSDAAMDFVNDLRFGFDPQVTDRAANTMINAAYAPELFWDGRASGTFRDPLTNNVLIATGGTLESQSVGPPVSNVEMAHSGVNWVNVAAKIAGARPLELASNIPADVAAALFPGTTYRHLFLQAFGDDQVTPARIAMAIATYERTLISDDTPWDRTQLGLPGGMTSEQQEGFDQFGARRCALCHIPPLFTDNQFRNIGVRPPIEDLGRQNVTGNTADRGRFKTATVRNVGLKSTFMHNGRFASVADVLLFYARAPGSTPPFPDNLDPIMSVVTVPDHSREVIHEFLVNGLLDVRVRDGLFPFDRPTLTSERSERQITRVTGGEPGNGGIIPAILADIPAMVGSSVRTGVHRAAPGAAATLGVSLVPPVAGKITPDRFLGGVTVSAGGLATLHWDVDPADFSDGQVVYLQWFVEDPSAVGGTAMSDIARVPVFCGLGGCPVSCTADFNHDGQFDSTDFYAYLGAFFAGTANANVNGDDVIDSSDFFAFLSTFLGGC